MTDSLIVRRAVMTRLRQSLPVELGRVEALHGLPMPVPRSWASLPDARAITETQAPAVYVVSAGIDFDDDTLDTSGGALEVRVMAIVYGRSYDETLDRTGGYVTAIRHCLEGDPTLNGVANGGQATNEAWDELDTTQARTIGAGSVRFSYSVDFERTIENDPQASNLTIDMRPIPVTTSF